MTATMQTPAVTPYTVAPDTFVIPQLELVPGHGYTYLNSLLITGREPVIVDTGCAMNREQWMSDVFSKVDPRDVRWIYLSHDDNDHVGNLRTVLDLCPNARLITTHFMAGRIMSDGPLPLERAYFLNDSESLDLGDRTITAIRPPYFDSPTTRGLFDSKTGVYWAADCFSALLPHAAEDAADVDPAAYREGFLMANRLNHPWFELLDKVKFGRKVDQVESLPIRAIAMGHGPAIYGPQIATAFRLIREIPSLKQVHEPTQAEFQAMMAALAGEPTPLAAD